MTQFFLPPDSIEEKTFRLSGPEAFHIAKVLRYGQGQSLDLFDGRGGHYTGTIGRILPDGSVEGEITGTRSVPHALANVRLNLYQGLLKASHWEWVLEKGTEVGVSSFIPVLTPRTVVLLREEDRAKSKEERWSRIILAASKQSGRSHLPELAPPAAFRDAVRAAKETGLVLLAWEKMAGTSAKESLRESLRAAAQAKGPVVVNLFIGPEGGFSEDEVKLAESQDAVLFGLGANILRAETAAIACSSLILYELGAL